MFFEGNTTSLIEAMRLKRDFIRSGQPEAGPRILFVGGGGVMYGCEAGGTVTAIHEAGFGEVFDWVVGLSTSAPGVTYFLSGNPRVGTSIYYEECCSKEFLNPLRLHRPVDTKFLDDVFRGKTGKAYDLNQVFNHRTELILGVTNAQTGKQTLARPRTPEELYQVIHASISIPGITGQAVYINGRPYTDGAMSNPLPLRQLFGTLQPTHVVIIPNRTREVSEKVPISEWVLNDGFFRSGISPQMREHMKRRRQRLTESLRWLREECPIPYLIAWSGGEIEKFERNSEKIRDAAICAETQWRDLLL